jgi:hypothetical protein
MAIIRGEFTISIAITEKGEQVVFDMRILDHKNNSHIARYTIDMLGEFYGQLMELINDYINEEFKNEKRDNNKSKS